VIGLAGDDLVGAVKLLEQDHARQLMGEGDRSERQAMVDSGQLRRPEGAADHEAEVLTALAALFEEAAERRRPVAGAVDRQQRGEGARGEPPLERLVVGDFDDLKARVAAQQLDVVLGVIHERRALFAHGDDHDPHDGILRRMDENPPERHINIHFAPEVMAGHYANFANVSHSDYEFTITYARVDHEVEEEEVPGVVVSRINLSAKFMRELIDAMEDNYSKWLARENIKNLPEFGGGAQ
jgi:hypothetical protein